MAYGLKYKAEFATPNINGHIYLDEDGYAGSVTDLVLVRESTPILSREFEDWDTHIIGTTLEFDIYNNKSNYFDLLELMTATERQFRVRVVTSTNEVLFAGFLNVDTVNQKYLNFQMIHLVASSYLSKLEHVIPPSIEVLQKMSFITIIDEILQLTGAVYNIRVNNTLHPANLAHAINKSLFNTTGFYTETFWLDNIDRKNGLEILNEILKTFNSYLYWWDGYWYIERYLNIWQTGFVTYVEYTASTSYTPISTAANSLVARNTLDVHSLQFIETSQELSCFPGYKLIRLNVNVEKGLLLNLTINDFKDIIKINEFPLEPQIRTWKAFKDNTDQWHQWALPLFGTSYRDVSQVVFRQFWVGGIYGTFPTPSGYVLDEFDFTKGIATSFEITKGSETKLSIRFKYGTKLDQIMVAPPTMPNFSDYEFEFHWLLQGYNSNTYVAKDENDEWIYRNSDYPDSETIGGDGVTILPPVLQSTFVQGTSFSEDGSVEVSIDVPLNEVANLIDGDLILTFTIGTEAIWKTTDNKETYDPGCSKFAWMGDVIITTNSELENGLIEGTINTKFLNRKEIDLDLFDTANKNYKNGVLMTEGLNMPTETWIHGANTDDEYSLVEWTLVDQFRLHNVTRQRVMSQIVSQSIPRLLQLYTDSKQSDKKFVLMGLRHYLTEDIYEVDLLEYDNETEINLITE